MLAGQRVGGDCGGLTPSYDVHHLHEMLYS